MYPCRCGGNLFPKRIEWRESNGFSSTTFSNVPALVCPKCGATELDGDSIDLLIAYLNEFPVETIISWGEVIKWRELA